MLLWELGFLHGNSKLWVYERLDFQIDSRILSQCFYGNFKLSNESIATVRKDLATDYQALADRHLEEVAQILEEYGATEVEIAHKLQTNEADRLATGEQPIEIVELPDSSQKARDQHHKKIQ